MSQPCPECGGKTETVGPRMIEMIRQQAARECAEIAEEYETDGCIRAAILRKFGIEAK